MLQSFKKGARLRLLVLELLLGLLVLPLLSGVGGSGVAMAAGPDPATGEARQSLDGTWKFKTDAGNTGESASPTWYSTSLDDSSWDTQPVPGNWDTTDAYANYRGKAWYRLTFPTPSGYSGFPVRLRFEAVYNQAKVWLNGTLLGQHNGGYSPFEFDVTALLNYTGNNVLVVKPDNTNATGAWWPWGGISRDVNLIANNQTRIEWQKITSTPDLTAGTAAINVQVKLDNTSATAQTVTVQPTIYDKVSGSLIWNQTNDAAFTTSVMVAANSSTVAQLNTTLPANKVTLWDFDHPYLYRMDMTIQQGSTLLHKISNNFGVRKIEIVSGAQVKLNGQIVRLVGFNRVPDDRVNGNTEPDYLFKRDVDYMKSMGANMARLFHTPLKPELLDYLDEKGMLIIEEIPVWGSGYDLSTAQYPTSEQWLTEMINRDYNHPSIISWSPGNEIAGSSTNGINYVHDMFTYIRANLDSSRYLTYTSNTAAGVSSATGDASQWSDFIDLNQYGGYAAGVTQVHSLWPDKPIFISEYGTSFSSEDPNNSDINADSILSNYRDKNYMLGASLWTLNDYRSTYSDTPASQNRPWGVTTTWGDKKKGFTSLQKAYSPVKAFSTNQNTATFTPGQTVTTGVFITPRSALDMPQYSMIGYKLKWEIYDPSYNLTDGGVLDLPQLNPGDSVWSTGLNWQVPAAGLFQQHFTVISPTGYELYDYSNYFAAPAAPTIKQVLVADGTARVVFNSVNGATSYKVKYGVGSLTSTTATTIDNFADITGLTDGTTYQFAVVATNSKSDSAASTIVTATPASTNTLLPPKIWDTVPVKNGFYIGYSTDSTDNGYTVEYGTSSGSYPNTLTFTGASFIKGALAVPNLSADTTYYFRMSRTNSSSGTSAFSQEVAVTTEGSATLPPAPNLLAALKGDKEVTLSFTPVPKAVGYRVKYGTTAGSYTTTLNFDAAAIGQVVVPGLINGTTYYFTISALNANGESANATARSVTPGPISTTTPPGSNSIIIDNGQAGYSETGTWVDSSLTGYNGTSTRYSNTPGSTATWTPTITAPGQYNVYVYYPASSVDTTNAQYTIAYSGGSASVGIDQTQNGGSWVLLGNYTFAAGASGSVTLTVASTDYYRADAVKFEPTSVTLFSDDFEDGNSTGWTVVNGTWSVVSDGTDVYKQTNTAGEGLTVAGDTTWTNYSVQAKVKLYDLISLAASGIIARYTDSNNYYMLRLHQSGQLQLYKKVAGTFTQIGSATVSVATNTVYTLKLTVSGSSLTGYLNGTALISTTDSSLTNGEIGARTYTQTASFDEFQVTAP